MEAWFALQRDREQRHALMEAQMRERQVLQGQIAAARERHRKEVEALHRDAANYRLMSRGKAPNLTSLHEEADRKARSAASRLQDRPSAEERLERLRDGEPRGADLDRGPAPEHER